MLSHGQQGRAGIGEGSFLPLEAGRGCGIARRRDLYASTLDAAARQCSSRHPALVFADLSDAEFPAAATAARIRADAPEARIVGFASHVDLKSLKAAREAGFDLTLSRSEFTARLAELLSF